MEIETFLNQTLRDYHREDFLSSDPLEFVHRYSDPWDQEVVAFVSALLAYGNVKIIRRSVEDLLQRFHRHANGPADFVKKMGTSQGQKKAQKVLESFFHRFNQGDDFFCLLQLMEKSWKENGSVGAEFLKNLRSEDKNIENVLNTFILAWKEKADRPQNSFFYLLTAPKDGSCCKRWCMLLRWLGRKDQLDVGLWQKESPLAETFQSRGLLPRQLVMPLDTHTGRISRALGLTPRKSMNWKAAIEVTESLKKWDAQDPTRFDFSLARPGILKHILEFKDLN